MKIISIVSIFIATSFSGLLHASHLAGGDITYKCLGGNLYEVLFTIYQNCDASSQVGSLSSEERIDIYNSAGVNVQTLTLQKTSDTQITGNAPNPCTAIPTGICLNVGEYKATVNLPSIPGGYQLVYKRCCRNGGIVNGPAADASYSTFIPDVSVAACNSSAVFNDFPPVFICKDLPFTFDHSATDADGDVLTYALCAPLESAVPLTPYPFNAGYSVTNPLGTGNSISIDANTGQLTALPTSTGKHVVGICVSEFRNGKLINTLTRDFQLNVVECEKTVVAAGLSTLTNCEKSEVTFFNTTTGAINYEWNFGDGSPFSTAFSPTHTYTSLGNYNVQLIGFATNPLCNDTLTTLVAVVDSCRPCGLQVEVTKVDGNCGPQTPVCSEVVWEHPCGAFTINNYPTRNYSGSCSGAQGGGSGSANAPDLSSINIIVNGVTLPTSSTIQTITPLGGTNCPAMLSFPTTSGGQTTFKFNAMVTPPQAGSAAANVTGGTPPYTITWITTPAQTGMNATALNPGNYDVVVTDANGCTEVVNFTIGGDTPLSVAPTATDVSGCGANDGTLNANASNVNGTATYSWVPGGYTTANVNSVPPGTYTVTVTDVDNCPATGTVTVGGVPTLDITTVVVDAKCATSTDGSAEVTNVTGGGGGYTYSWNTSPVQTTAKASNLPKGFYTVTATDVNGCTGQKSLTVGGPPAMDLVLNGTDASCSDVNDGEVEVVVTGGTPNYNYSWNTTPVQGGSKATGLAGDNEYVVTVTDGNGCIAKDSIEIDHPPHLDAEVEEKSTISCTGVFDGAAEVTASGGTTPYAYTWDCSALTTPSVSGLPLGACNVTVTDGNGCVAQEAFNIINPGVLTAAVTSTNACGANTDGTATATPTGGFGPYTYSWDCSTATTQAISGLAAGSNCTVTITDAGGCTATALTNIGANPGLTLDTLVTPDCDNTTVGAIDLTVLTGTAPYIYNWSNGATVEDISSLTGDSTYKITVFDANNCFDTLSVDVGMVACRPTLSLSTTNDSICIGDSTTLTAFAIGGTPGFMYLWDNGITDVTAGPQTVKPIVTTVYEVEVTDVLGGKDTATITIHVNPLPIVTLAAFSDVCLAVSSFPLTGGIPSGGTYSGTGIIANNFDPSVAGLGTHVITYTFIDGNGCVDSATSNITVILPTNSVLGFIDFCVDAPTVNLSGGSPPGSVYVGPGIINDSIFDPALAGTGTHIISYTVTDSITGCLNSGAGSLTVNPLPVATLGAYPDVCVDAADFLLAGGTPINGTYSGTGVGGGNFSPSIAGAGTHTITYTFTDANGCSNSDSALIKVNPLPIITLSLPPDVCINATPFNLTGENPTGGIYSGPGVAAGIFDPSNAGVGNHVVSYGYTDTNGCKDTAQDIIVVNLLPVLTQPAYSDVCLDLPAFTLTNGDPTGGTYSGTGVTSNNFDPSVAGLGTHVITYEYTDTKGCVGIPVTANITVNPLPTVNAGLDDAFCAGATITLNANGIGSGITYSWTPSADLNDPLIFNPVASPTTTTDYMVTVTDVNGCEAKDTVNIEVQTSPVIAIAAPTVCLGTPTIFTNNSTPTINTVSLWNFGDGNTSNLRDPVHPYADTGTYTVNLTETTTAGCTTNSSFQVRVGYVPTVEFSGVILAECPGFEEIFTITSADYDSNYTYIWNFGDGSPEVINAISTNSQTHTYLNSGIFDVSLIVITPGPENCTNDSTRTAYITVHPDPQPAFKMDPNETTIFDPEISFTNLSTGEDTWLWDFGDSTESILEHPQHVYADTGHYDIQLIIENSGGCIDSVTLQLFIKDVFTFYAPNSFTPDGNGLNEKFIPKFYAADLLEGYTFSIYNRWGELLFQTHDTNASWDGTHKNKQVPLGTYIWKVQIQDIYKEAHQYIGHISVIR